MTETPSRLLRPQAECCRSPQPLTAKDHERQEYILAAAQNMFIAHGRANVSLPQFCYAIRMSQLSVRRAVSDMHHVFRLILSKYLDGLIAALSKIPREPDGLLIRRRAEYFRLTRGILNIPTPLHFLLVRDRFSLPDDELDMIEMQRGIIGGLVGGNEGENTLLLLDAPTLDLDRIESMIDSMNAERPPRHAPLKFPPEPEPEPETTQAPTQARPLSPKTSIRYWPAMPGLTPTAPSPYAQLCDADLNDPEAAIARALAATLLDPPRTPLAPPKPAETASPQNSGQKPPLFGRVTGPQNAPQNAPLWPAPKPAAPKPAESEPEAPVARAKTRREIN